MVTKSRKKTDTPSDSPPPSGSVKDSAQQIWQAGLGAFTRAQAEGSKAFETLVKEGINIQRKTQAVAEERLTEATQKMSSMASEIGNKASGQWDKLENIFEDRVAKAMGRLGVPSANDVAALNARIDALSKAVQQLSAKAPTKAPSKVAVKTAAKAAAKTPRKAAAKTP